MTYDFEYLFSFGSWLSVRVWVFSDPIAALAAGQNALNSLTTSDD